MRTLSWLGRKPPAAMFWSSLSSSAKEWPSGRAANWSWHWKCGDRGAGILACRYSWQTGMSVPHNRKGVRAYGYKQVQNDCDGGSRFCADPLSLAAAESGTCTDRNRCARRNRRLDLWLAAVGRAVNELARGSRDGRANLGYAAAGVDSHECQSGSAALADRREAGAA